MSLDVATVVQENYDTSTCNANVFYNSAPHDVEGAKAWNTKGCR